MSAARSYISGGMPSRGRCRSTIAGRPGRPLRRGCRAPGARGPSTAGVDPFGRFAMAIVGAASLCRHVPPPPHTGGWCCRLRYSTRLLRKIGIFPHLARNTALIDLAAELVWRASRFPDCGPNRVVGNLSVTDLATSCLPVAASTSRARRPALVPDQPHPRQPGRAGLCRRHWPPRISRLGIGPRNVASRIPAI